MASLMETFPFTSIISCDGQLFLFISNAVTIQSFSYQITQLYHKKPIYENKKLVMRVPIQDYL